jgi:hypothetical protein
MAYSVFMVLFLSYTVFDIERTFGYENLTSDTGFIIDQTITEKEDLPPVETKLKIERFHTATTRVGEQVEIELRISNIGNIDVALSVMEILRRGVVYLDPIETHEEKYGPYVTTYYLWKISLPAGMNTGIRYHIQSETPQMIMFQATTANDQYGNHFDSAPTIIEVVCAPNGVCNTGENSMNCPEDCTTGIADDRCDGKEDQICDPDCTIDGDIDCRGLVDSDNDSVTDSIDNCPTVANRDQVDSDFDGRGNACDGCPNDPDKTELGICGCGVDDNDSDVDGVLDCKDNCPNTYNPDQADINNNGIGNVCEPDTTPPTIVFSGCPLKINLMSPASFTVAVTDSESDVAYQSVPNGINSLDTSTVGTKTFTVTARDNRGNTGSNSCTYQVIYDFLGAGGFHAPIDDQPITNIAKAGSTIPVKWQIPNGKGGFISDLGAVISIQFQQVACLNFSNTLTAPVEAPATGDTGLRYDFTANQFIYNWKTSKTQAGGCYVLNLTLNDGMRYQANFSMK